LFGAWGEELHAAPEAGGGWFGGAESVEGCEWA